MSKTIKIHNQVFNNTYINGYFGYRTYPIRTHNGIFLMHTTPFILYHGYIVKLTLVIYIYVLFYR